MRPNQLLKSYYSEKIEPYLLVTYIVFLNLLQPRKIAASAVATRVCQENNWELGTLVGYKVGDRSLTFEI